MTVIHLQSIGHASVNALDLAKDVGNKPTPGVARLKSVNEKMPRPAPRSMAQRLRLLKKDLTILAEAFVKAAGEMVKQFGEAAEGGEPSPIEEAISDTAMEEKMMPTVDTVRGDMNEVCDMVKGKLVEAVKLAPPDFQDWFAHLLNCALERLWLLLKFTVSNIATLVLKRFAGWLESLASAMVALVQHWN